MSYGKLFQVRGATVGKTTETMLLSFVAVYSEKTCIR